MDTPPRQQIQNDSPSSGSALTLSKKRKNDTVLEKEPEYIDGIDQSNG